MIGVTEAFHGGYKFQADDACLTNSLRYGSVSHTALHGPTVVGVGLKSGLSSTPHAMPTLRTAAGGWDWQACVNKLTRARFWKLVLLSALRNIANMERPKLASLLGLVVQTSLLALTTRYSRTSKVDGPRYLSSTAVVNSEIFKALICLVIVIITSKRTLMDKLSLLTNSRDVFKSCVPSLLYTFQNNLQYVAMTYLDAATFQVTYQLKILTTAMFSVCFLRKRLDVMHWSSLLLLTAGVAMVQFPRSIECGQSAGDPCNLTDDVRFQRNIIGMFSVLAMCLSSGFAGVYTEKIVKSANSVDTLWIRNLQLALTSTVMALVCVYLFEGDAMTSSGYFQGYDAVTWIVILQQALLGLVTALVMKYADNILKGFASAIAIVATTMASYFILHDLHLSCSFLIGTVIVMGSALLYNVDRNIDVHSPETVI